MEKEQQQLEALQDIRKMMKDSSKFLSLSGLSGVFAGVYALIGAWAGHILIKGFILSPPDAYNDSYLPYYHLLFKLILTCGAVLGLSIVTALLLSGRKAKRNNQKLFDHTSKKVLWNMLVPLTAGGFFCLSLLFHGDMIVLVSPVMLLFYGMALINASKYTMSDIKYLGYLEITLGIAASFFLGYGLLFWALGFGVLHIIYGSIMWFKYDRN